jgi:hypothetical protein
MLEEFFFKSKLIPVLELVLQASSQLWNPLISEGPNNKLNPLSDTHRDSPEWWAKENKDAK